MQCHPDKDSTQGFLLDQLSTGPTLRGSFSRGSRLLETGCRWRADSAAPTETAAILGGNPAPQPALSH